MPSTGLKSGNPVPGSVTWGWIFGKNPEAERESMWGRTGGAGRGRITLGGAALGAPLGASL